MDPFSYSVVGICVLLKKIFFSLHLTFFILEGINWINAHHIVSAMVVMIVIRV